MDRIKQAEISEEFSKVRHFVEALGIVHYQLTEILEAVEAFNEKLINFEIIYLNNLNTFEYRRKNENIN